MGAGRYVVVQPGRAEVAFAVDHYQRQGLGSTLMGDLAAIARQAGLNQLIAEVLGSNGAMLKVFEKSGLVTNKTHDGPVIHVTLARA